MKKNITVLGIHDGHDAGAALIRNGKVIAALQEERPRAIKHYSGVPELAIKKVFQIANINPAEVDLITIAGLVRTHAPLKEESLKVKLFEKISPIVASKTFAKFYVRFLHRFRKMKELNQIFQELDIYEKEVIFVDHHLAHASCAYRYSPWSYKEPVLIFTADGAGDGLSSTVSTGLNGTIQRIDESIYYNSLGNVLYSEITRFLGLKPWDHEYKVMALAPYGKAEYCIDQIRKIIRLNPWQPLQFQNTIGAYTNGVQSKLRNLLACQRFDNIAAATQQWFEELILKWVRNALNQTGISKIVCAGGLFLNVKANKKIDELPEVEDAFFYPAAGGWHQTWFYDSEIYPAFWLESNRLNPSVIAIDGRLECLFLGVGSYLPSPNSIQKINPTDMLINTTNLTDQCGVYYFISVLTETQFMINYALPTLIVQIRSQLDPNSQLAIIYSGKSVTIYLQDIAGEGIYQRKQVNRLSL